MSRDETHLGTEEDEEDGDDEEEEVEKEAGAEHDEGTGEEEEEEEGRQERSRAAGDEILLSEREGKDKGQEVTAEANLLMKSHQTKNQEGLQRTEGTSAEEAELQAPAESTGWVSPPGSTVDPVGLCPGV